MLVLITVIDEFLNRESEKEERLNIFWSMQVFFFHMNVCL